MKATRKSTQEANIASKSSFCMKVQTVGHKQNSGSYIAKCVSNWLLKCIIILYYQVRPLLKFDHVSVSYRLIEVILFTVFISLSPFFLYSLVVLCLDAYVNLTFTSCKTELSLINHLVLSINNSQKSALAENSSRTATPAANSSPLSPQSNQASQQQETLSGIPSSQKPYNEVILFTVFISLSPFFLYSLVVLCLDAYVNLTFTSCKTELSLINHLVLSINNSQKSALAENSSRTATPAANSSPLSPQSNQASQQQETLSGIPSSQKPYNGQLTPLALTFVPQNYANQPSIEPDSTHRTMHSSVDSKVC